MFPITGDLREVLLFMEWIIAFCYLEFGIINIIKFTSKKGIKRNPQTKAYGFLFFSYFFIWFWKILADYYAPDETIRTILFFLGFIIQCIFGIGSMFLIGVIKKGIKKLSIALSFIFLIEITLSLILLDIRLIQFFSTSISFVFIFLFIFYLWNVVINKNLRKNFPFYFSKFFFSLGFLIIGVFLVNDRAIELFGIEVRFLGDHFQLIGLFLLYWFITTLPSLSEIDWQDKIHQITIMNKGGLHIFTKTYNTAKTTVDNNLISGLMTTIQIMLEKITEKRDDLIITREGVTIVLYPGALLNGIVLSSKDLNSLKNLLKSFVNRIEAVYSSVLEGWGGDLTIFGSIEKICDSIFKY